MTTMNIPDNLTIKQLLTEFSPRVAKDSIARSGGAAGLAGTRFTLVMDVDGQVFHYDVKDGSDFTVGEGSIADPLVHIAISKADLEKMIAQKSLDMLLGIQSDLNRAKYDVLQRLNGKMTALLDNEDGTAYKITATFNGKESPACSFKLTTADSAALMRKEVNPVNLFMSGRMKIEGDMAFAMSTQPLFT
jgi:hypothetical protein